MDKKRKQLESLAQTLCRHLDITLKAVKISQEEAGNLVLNLDLPEQEAGRLIGYHGETIAGLQLLLNLMLYQQTGEWAQLIVNVGDYRKKRAEYLTAMAEDTAAKVTESGEPLALYNLNPFERRTVHVALAERDDVVTESQGEGKNRFLVISPASGGQAQ